MLDVNLTGTFHCCQVALPDMVAAGWGRIVTISSSSAQRGTPAVQRDNRRQHPAGPPGHRRRHRRAVGFLCSDEAGFITGQTLGVNGGSVM